MRVTGFTHVSIHAHDLEVSVRFYKEVFGMEEIPSPTFPFPVRWLRVGDLQLHLIESEAPAPAAHHFGIDVDDFETVYLKVKELGIQDTKLFPPHIYELPSGAVQMYVRDPADNLVEINWPDAATLDHSVVTDIKKFDTPQEGDALRATLYMRR